MKKIAYSLFVATAISTFSASTSAQMLVGASSINSTDVATAVGAVYLYDQNNGTLTNNAKIVGNGSGDSTIVATGVSNSILINSSQVRADGSNGIAVNSVKTIQNTGLIRSLSGTAIHVASGVSNITNEAGSTITSGGSHVIHVAAGTSNTTVTNRGIIEAKGNGGVAIAGARTISNSGTIRSLAGDAIRVAWATGTITNEVGGKIESHGIGGSAIVGATNITNFGEIKSLSGDTIELTQASNTNLITNETSGKIISNGDNRNTIDISSNVNSTILNNGTIEARGNQSTALNNARNIENFGLIRSLSGTAINVATGVSTLDNKVGGKIASGGAHTIHIADGMSNATLTNAGLVEARSANSIAIEGAKTITNSGTIRSLAGDAIRVSTNVSSITNAAGGKIIAKGTDATTIQVTSNVSGTTVINQGQIRHEATLGSAINSVETVTNSGLIRSLTGTAIRVSTGVSTITNEVGGKIASGGSHAIHVASNVSGTTIINNGLIEVSSANGIAIEGGQTITNSGTIRSLAGDAIHIASGVSSITNEAGGKIITLVSGKSAIDNSANSNTMTLNNAGEIRGDIRFGSGADVLNVTDGKIVGDIIGQGNNDTINFSATSFNTRGIFNNIGDINVNVGLLTLNHAINGNVNMSIANGATVLANHSTIGSNAVANNGVLEVTANNAPTLSGDYSQSATGRLRLHVNGNSNGVLNVDGTATLETGTSVDAIFESGLNIGNGEAYIVVDAGTLVTNPNDLNITSNNAFVSLIPSTVNDDLILTTMVASQSQAQSNLLLNAQIASPIQLQALAGGGAAGTNVTQSLAGFSGLMNELQVTDPTEFDRINSQFGELDGAATVQAINNIKPNAAAMAGATSAVFSTTTSGNNIVTSRLGHARAMRETQLAGGNFLHAFQDKKFGDDLQVWAQPFLSNVNRGAHKGVSGFDANSYGLLMGADIGISANTRIGASLGYGQTEVTLRSNGSDGADIDNYQASLYGTYMVNENFYLDGIVGLGFNEYETSETVGFLSTQTNADYDGMQYNARLGAGYDIHTPAGFVITPNAFVQYTHLSQEAYTTTGNGLNRHTQEMDTDSIVTSAGLKLAYPYTLEQGNLVPYIRGSYLHEGGDDEQTVTSTFVGGGSSFTTTSPSVSRDAVHLGGGIDFHSHSDVRVGANLDYTTRDDQNTLAGALRIRMPF